MHNIELIVGLVLVSAVLAGLARAIGVHYAIVLVLGGLALGFVPGLPTPRVDPNIVLFVFLPPLIYSAAFQSSPQDLRGQVRPIGLLAVGLVLVTMFGVAAVIHAVAGFGWGPALVLGAVLGPTDPVAATSVLRRLGAPDRTSTILEGEALVNDGTGLTTYKLAVGAVVSGHFSLGSGVLDFIGISVGGAAIGLAAGWLSVQIRRRIDEPPLEISISLLTAYLAYIPADNLGASGVLAAVTSGLYAGSRTGLMLSPTSRLRTLAFWETLTFLLESVLFLLIGLELPHLTSGLHVGTPLIDAGAVIGALVVLRVGWMFVIPPLERQVARLARRSVAQPSPRERAVLGWSGMRGGVSLAAALAIPLTARGVAFPDRNTLIFVAYVAIAVSLIVPGLTLSWLVRRLGLGQGEEAARREARARLDLAHAALRRVEELAEREELPEPVSEQLRMTYELRIHRLESAAGEEAEEDDGRMPETYRIRDLRRELISVERRRLDDLRRTAEISADAQRRIEHELDLEESRLAA